MVKDLKKNAGKATKGLLGFVSGAVQRTAEYLTHQEMTVGSYKVQIVREMAEGGVCVLKVFVCCVLLRMLLGRGQAGVSSPPPPRG